MTQEETMHYPYRITFSYNKKSYTHEFSESVYPDIERQKQKCFPKDFFGVAVLGIKDSFEHYELMAQDITKTEYYDYVRSVIQYDLAERREVALYLAISLKDDWEILKDI